MDVHPQKAYYQILTNAEIVEYYKMVNLYNK